jgi:glycosyltransferase involved in cell wall biosynthesis
MRILHVIAGAEHGGAETFARDTIVALGERGITQHVIARSHPAAVQRFEAGGASVANLAFSRLDRLRGAGQFIRAEAERFAPDLAHAWMSRAASFVPAQMPCPVAGWFGGYYDLKYYRHADFYVGVTKGIVDYLLTEGAAGHRTLPPLPPASRAALQTPKDAILVLVMSRLHEKKGIDTMLRALALCPGLYLWLAGEGPERAAYEALATALGLDERVRFLGWRDDRAALYGAADLVALPSRYEPFGTVIPEAWSMGKALIATRAAGAAAHVTDGSDGILCPVDDPPALAAALVKLARDPALRNRLAANGRRVYERLFTREVVIASLLDSYQKMLRIGRRASR